jgi:chemotaxis protein CheX
MTDEDLKPFVSGTANFFVQVGSVPAEIDTPFVKEKDDHVMSDFSAIIGVTGNQRGCVYYTAPREMLKSLVKRLGEPDLSDDICADYVGEIANTISGNARETLGAGFKISTPLVIRGEAGEVQFPSDAPAFVVPIVWGGFRSALIICLKDERVLNAA